MQAIYKKYRERLIEISGNNRTLLTRKIIKKYSFDIGELLENVDCEDFYSFLWKSKSVFELANEKFVKKLNKASSAAEKNTDDYLNRLLTDLRYLKREVDDIQKETGRYDLFIGYPYVFGKIDADIEVKAPLLLFPVSIEIERDKASVSHISDQPVMVNKSLILAYCKETGLKSDSIIQEFDTESSDFKDAYDVIDYLATVGIKIRTIKRKGLMTFDPESELTISGLEFRNMAVLGRFPFANQIYSDYLLLEKNNLTTPGISLLIEGKVEKQKKKKTVEDPATYTINDLDFAQENAIEKINSVDNLVIYGPPGTGKSQTIVNIISDALCKDKRVLVVSQKQAALDVVFSRLGELNSKAMLIPDPEKGKSAFFARIKQLHQLVLKSDYSENAQKYQNIEFDINKELSTLEEINRILFTKTPFGLNYQEMYAQSYNFGKESRDYHLYTELKKSPLISKNYPELSADIKYISDKNVVKLFMSRQLLLEENPMVSHLLGELNMHQIKEARDYLEKILNAPFPPFNFSKYPHSRYLATFYLEKAADKRVNIEKIADIVTKVEKPELTNARNLSLIPLFWPILPMFAWKFKKYKDSVNINLNVALSALTDFEGRFTPLRSVLTSEGYSQAVGGLLNGNYLLLKNILSALENYIAIRDMNKALSELSAGIKDILTFSYAQSDGTRPSMQLCLSKVLPIRIYHEIIKNDKVIEPQLSKTIAFNDMREHILSLKTDQRRLAKLLAKDRFSLDYEKFFSESSLQKDFLYQIQKQRGMWPIRRMLEYFDEFLFRLFPCWLLSPETVSTILPLKRDMFDVVVFDEASQMFIENALPSVYRGKRIVVAGDNKQLRPSSGFAKRYLADDSFDPNVDLSMQAALEVESLLDLATAKFTPANLVYHYRSRFSELIDFSNIAFYENKLQIAPNITLSKDKPPIQRIKINGQWNNRKNHEEAVAVVKLVKQIFKEREFNETIGIVTFNAEQKEYIEDLLDAEADKVQTLRKQLFAERNRFEEGENRSIFVKNLENVQGDERDIIIFSIGYAKNEDGRVVAQFGSLSMEGGENRLNVAITRAKKQIYVVTSIEPEELDKVETTKNSGPKLLRRYLMYARAVSEGQQDEVKRLLSVFDANAKETPSTGAYEEQIKEGLTARGYEVFTNLGNTYYKLSLGVYDKDVGRFVLGIECDYQAFNSSGSVLERDVFRIKFLESRGWKIVRVWSRDWWHNKNMVLDALENAILTEKEKLLKITKEN